MPLIQSKSPKAFKKNVETEMKANPNPKDRAQNLAIAYSIKRKNQVKKAKGGHVHSEECMSEGGECKYAQGGTVTANDETEATADNQQHASTPHAPSEDSGSVDERAATYGALPEEDEDELGHSLSDTIRRRQKAPEHYMAKGGMAMAGRDAEDDEEPMVPSRKKDNMRLSEDEYMSNHFAKGGKAMEYGAGPEEDDEPGVPRAKKDNMRPSEEEYMSNHFASGGMMSQHGGEDEEDMGSAPHEAIMKRRKRSDEMMHLAEGGEVDLDKNSEEDLNNEDQLSYRAGLKEQYDDNQLSAQPMDSNETGDSREEDEENIDDADIVSALRRKMKASRR